MWFYQLTGFPELSPNQVRSNLFVDGTTLTSKVNGKVMTYGKLETPSLAELIEASSSLTLPTGRLTVSEVVANVQDLHTDPANAGALFQVASQFNLLEMMGPYTTPEAGVTIYEDDLTQGPACAIAAGAGTIYRNYFAEVNGRIGQTADNQIDCLADLGYALGNKNDRLWVMKNGYALPSREGLEEISLRLSDIHYTERMDFKELLKVGVQWDTQVTLNDCHHLVSQVYCSALPVAYTNHPKALWADFAQLVLDAAYEATFTAACLNFTRTGNPKLYLTLLGGGAFGNEEEWILSAIKRAIGHFYNTPLEVAIVSYGRSNSQVEEFLHQIEKVKP